MCGYSIAFLFAFLTLDTSQSLVDELFGRQLNGSAEEEEKKPLVRIVCVRFDRTSTKRILHRYIDQNDVDAKRVQCYFKQIFAQYALRKPSMNKKKTA